MNENTSIIKNNQTLNLIAVSSIRNGLLKICSLFPVPSALTSVPCSLLLILLLALSICSSGCRRSQATSFYLLAPVTGQEATPAQSIAPTSPTIAIAVFPVDLPAYLDRPQIVTRTGSNTLRFSEFHKWAEALGPAMRNVLVDDLAAILPSYHVSAQPGRKIVPYDYSVEVRVKRFEGVADNEAVLLADWVIFRAESGSAILRRTSSLSVPLETDGYPALADSLSRLIGDLSKEIAKEITTLSQRAAY